MQEEVEGMNKLIGWWLGEFTELRSEVFPCKNQGSLGDDDFEVHFPCSC